MSVDKSKSEIKKMLKSWKAEKSSAYLYSKLATVTQGCEKKLFNQLSSEAEEQAELWSQGLRSVGVEVPKSFKVSFRISFIAMLLKWFSPKQLKTILASVKIRGMSLYFAPHHEVGHPWPRSMEDVGRRHKTASANNLRAMVFGANDGLVSNASLILGMMGANTDPSTVILAGSAGLLAGAFSMAAGEYISVLSQRELYEYQIALEEEELALYPEAEKEEIKLIYMARGLDAAQADSLATTLMQDPKVALDTLARDELGINPDELVSPWGAAISSFISFSIGAFCPLLPYVLNTQIHHLYGVIGMTAGSLFVIGMCISLFTGRSGFFGGLRMMLIGLGAGSLTYFIGHLISGYL